MVAMALLCEPEVLVADEPTTALDVTVQAQILALLRELQRDFGTAIILITHETREKHVNAAIARIESLSTVVSKVTKLRMEALN